MTQNNYQKISRYIHPENEGNIQLNKKFVELKNKLYVYWRENNQMMQDNEISNSLNNSQLSQQHIDTSQLNSIYNRQIEIFTRYISQSPKLQENKTAVLNLFNNMLAMMQLIKNQAYNTLHYINQSILNCINVSSIKQGINELKNHVFLLKQQLSANIEHKKYLLLKEQFQIQKKQFISVVQCFQKLLGNSVLLYQPFINDIQHFRNQIYNSRAEKHFNGIELQQNAQNMFHSDQQIPSLSQPEVSNLLEQQFQRQLVQINHSDKKCGDLFENQQQQLEEILNLQQSIIEKAQDIIMISESQNMQFQADKQTQTDEKFNYACEYLSCKTNDIQNSNTEETEQCNTYNFIDKNYVLSLIQQIIQHTDQASCLFIYKSSLQYVEKLDFDPQVINNWNIYIEFYVLNQQQPFFNLNFLDRMELFPKMLYYTDKLTYNLEKILFDCCVMYQLIANKQSNSKILNLIGLGSTSLNVSD